MNKVVANTCETWVVFIACSYCTVLLHHSPTPQFSCCIICILYKLFCLVYCSLICIVQLYSLLVASLWYTVPILFFNCVICFKLPSERRTKQLKNEDNAKSRRHTLLWNSDVKLLQLVIKILLEHLKVANITKNSQNENTEDSRS